MLMDLGADSFDTGQSPAQIAQELEEELAEEFAEPEESDAIRRYAYWHQQSANREPSAFGDKSRLGS